MSLVIDFLKWTPRDELYQFLLDPSNYPNTELYEKKVATYTATLADTRLSDQLQAIGTFTDVLYAPFALHAMLNPIMWLANFIVSWPLIVFNGIKAAIVASGAILWTQQPLKWVPIPDPEDDDASK